MASQYYTRSEARLNGARTADVNNGDDKNWRRTEKEEKSDFMKEEKSDDEDECAICLDKWTLKGLHRAARLTCGHVFGYCCIKQWVMLKRNCPICKSSCSPHHMRGLYHILLFRGDRVAAQLRRSPGSS